MIVDVIMPKLGESITEGTIIEWKKEVGDTIIQDETILEISTGSKYEEYTIKEISVIDLFPQTQHIETAVLLTKVS